MKKNDFGKKALAVHKKLKGKVEIRPKAKVTNKADLSVYYTPGVAAVSSYLATHKDKLRDYTMKRNTVAVISDGSAVLGLGNIGPEGALPVMEGKAMLFKALADVDAIPIVLDTQETDEIISTIRHIAPAFGGINLEDIAAPQCFEVERRLHEVLDIPVMHDDQHGTAIISGAGLINAARILGKNLKDLKVVVSGAGASAIACAKFAELLKVDREAAVEYLKNDLRMTARVAARMGVM